VTTKTKTSKWLRIIYEVDDKRTAVKLVRDLRKGGFPELADAVDEAARGRFPERFAVGWLLGEYPEVMDPETGRRCSIRICAKWTKSPDLDGNHCARLYVQWNRRGGNRSPFSKRVKARTSASAKALCRTWFNEKLTLFPKIANAIEEGRSEL
jgi:hypothetical protein